MTAASVGFHCPECLKSGKQKVYRPGDLASKPTLVMGLIGVCVVAYLAQVSSGSGNWRAGSVTNDGLLFGPSVQDGEVWRMVTSGFLHAGIIHLAFNMYALYIFGPAVQQALGLVRAALVYAGGLFGGSAAVLLFNWGSPTLGASGAVLGLAGGLAAILWARGINITQTSLGTIFLLNLALPLFTNISFWGHFGGIVGGFAVAWVLVNVEQKMRQPRPVAIGAAAAVIAVLIAAGLAGAQLELSPIL